VRLKLRNSEVGVDDFGRSSSSSYLRGEINPSLARLRHLNYLDLSMNYFGGMSIPTFLGSIKKLKYLNLSGACFHGGLTSDRKPLKIALSRFI